MKLITFATEDGPRLGIVTEHGVIDVRRARREYPARRIADELPKTVFAFYRRSADYLPGLQQLLGAVTAESSEEWLYPESSLTYLPVVPDPGKIICIGLNYRSHIAETNAELPETPVLFSKFSNALAAHEETISIPSGAERVDYEGEMAVVMGQQARNIPASEALAYVLGYSIGNDLSVRDWQFRTSQWLLGKTPDKFLPLGPYLTTTDEVDDPQDLDIHLWLNSELRQRSNTRHMIFPIAEIISYISGHFTLEPGDVILTGTPEGVILGREEKVWLKPGDEITVTVDKLGVLHNRLT